jgi:hypothetical protein
MASFRFSLLFLLTVVVFLSSPVSAFGAGNIASLSKIEGKNWRHGDIEDMLKTVAFLRGHKWTSMMVKRVYFGNWLRDYSQAVDVGTLKGVQAGTIRILVWVLAFMSFGYATGEFEVTDERLGTYRPEGKPIKPPSIFTMRNKQLLIFVKNISTTPRTMPTTKTRGSMILVCDHP